MLVWLLFSLVYQAVALSDSTLELIEQFLPLPTAAGCNSSLLELTSRPHIAGDPLMENDTINYLQSEYEKLNLTTYLQHFDALLTYPGQRNVELTGPTTFTCSMQEPALDFDPTSSNPDNIATFNGYSAPGDVEAELVYANYGHPNDFKYLESLGINVSGKIVIVRYGAVFRGLKVYQAQIRGAAAVLIYSDPIDDGFVRGAVYPDGPWRNENSVQRGSCQYMMVCSGDPRRTEECLGDPDIDPIGNTIPSIPVQPLSYADATPLLQALRGIDAPPAWQGGLNFTYYIGPGPATVRVQIESTYTVANLTNIFAVFPGTDAADEYVIIGSHMDAWVLGAADPNSGTAALLEATRALAQLQQSGWQPKRTLVIAGWDAEEYGLIGSTYYVEHLPATSNATGPVVSPLDIPLANITAYVNYDPAVTGNTFNAGGTPSLKQLLLDITALIQEPMQQIPLKDAWIASGQSLEVLGAGSDYVPFIHGRGVSSLQLSFGGYGGSYHSIYDSYTWMATYVDPNFTYHLASAQIAGCLAIALTEEGLVPIDYQGTVDALWAYLDDTYQRMENQYADAPVDLTPLNTSIANFAAAVTSLNNYLSDSNSINRTLLENKDINALLYAIERSFIIPGGLPNRPFFKHALQAPDLDTGYGAKVFPGVQELLESGDIETATQQVKILSERLEVASALINDFVPSDSDDSDDLTVVIVVVVILGVLLILAVVYCLYRRKKKGEYLLHEGGGGDGFGATGRNSGE